MMSALYGQTVAVSARRYESGRQLWQESPDLKVFVLDDGFQHRALAREVDVVLLGADWQGSMLPAGPFRESLEALKRADVILVTAAHDEWRSRLDDRCDPSKVFFGELKPCMLVTRVDKGWGEEPLSSISGAKVLSVSAIANPASFYQMLRDWDAVIVDTLEYPDHHCYTTADWHEISRRAQTAEKIVTTEKDLVKLVRYPFAMGSLFALRVEMIVERKEVLLERITARLFGE
jgi:tetraacyldisaccharide 4'-kinase